MKFPSILSPLVLQGNITTLYCHYNITLLKWSKWKYKKQIKYSIHSPAKLSEKKISDYMAENYTQSVCLSTKMRQDKQYKHYIQPQITYLNGMWQCKKSRQILHSQSSKVIYRKILVAMTENSKQSVCLSTEMRQDKQYKHITALQYSSETCNTVPESHQILQQSYQRSK